MVTDLPPIQETTAEQLVSLIRTGDIRVEITDNGREFVFRLLCSVPVYPPYIGNQWDVRNGGTVTIHQGVSLNVYLCAAHCHNSTSNRSVETFETAISISPDEGAELMQIALLDVSSNESLSNLAVSPHPATDDNPVSRNTSQATNESTVSLPSLTVGPSSSVTSFQTANQRLEVLGDVTFCSCTQCSEYAIQYSKLFGSNFATSSRHQTFSFVSSARSAQQRRCVIS